MGRAATGTASATGTQPGVQADKPEAQAELQEPGRCFYAPLAVCTTNFKLKYYVVRRRVGTRNGECVVEWCLTGSDPSHHQGYSSTATGAELASAAYARHMVDMRSEGWTTTAHWKLIPSISACQTAARDRRRVSSSRAPRARPLARGGRSSASTGIASSRPREQAKLPQLRHHG